MSEQFSNVNSNQIALVGNTGQTKYYLEPALLRALVLVPKGTIIPASAMVSPTAFGTYVAAAFINNSTSVRWRAFVNLDKFENKTKAASSEDTGLFQTMVSKFNTLYNFRYMTGMGNYLEAVKNFNNCQNFYDVFFIDANGTWQGTQDSTGGGGLQAFNLYQLFVEDRKEITTTTLNAYTISVGLANRREMNEQFNYYAAGTDIEAIVMPQSVVLTDVTSVVSTALSLGASDIAVVGTFSEGAADLGQYYGYHTNGSTSLFTIDCFAVTDLTNGSANPITVFSTKDCVVAGQTYNCFVLTVTTNTSGHVNQVALASISAINAIVPSTNLTTEVNGYASHTF